MQTRMQLTWLSYKIKAQFSQSPEESLDMEPIFNQQEVRFSLEYFRLAMNSHHS